MITDNEILLKVDGLKKSFGAHEVLKGINLDIHKGEVVVIIGASGSGKSTFLRCLNCLEDPTGGDIYFDGVDIADPSVDINIHRQKMGMVFQHFNLFPHMTVLRNMTIAPMKLLGKSQADAEAKAIELLKTVGLEDRAESYPAQLSGGQKQRVAIVRALAMEPDVMLFDEPTSALDPTMVGEVQSVIRELAKMGKTMMIVTHEMKFAREICNRVFYMDQGGIYEDGTPEQIFDNPQKELTRRFVRRLKLTEIRITPEDFDPLRCMNELNLYLFKNQIPVRMRHSIEAVFEELCLQILKPSLEKPEIDFISEYDEAKGTVSINVLYNGAPFDPRKSENDIALSILQANAAIKDYASIDEAPYTNKVTLAVNV